MLKKIGKQKTRWLSMLLALTVTCLMLPSFAAISAAAESTNLALGKTATASSEDYAATVAGKAVDGQDNTSWSSSGRSNADPFNEWLMVDLGEVTEIGRYVVKHHGATAYNTQNFQVQYSTNGSDWTLADTVTGNTDATTSRVLPDAITARYVKLVVTKPEDLEHTVIAARIKEFELYAPSVTVSSSNVNNEYPAENVLKDDSSQWVALNCSADNPQWVMIDFGKTQTFNRWIVNHFQANNHAFNTSDYQLQYKQGDAWITADTVTGNQAGSTDRTVEAFTARYVRLYITKPTYNGDNNVRITRFALSDDGEYTATYSASSVNNQSLYTADKAFDGNTTTEWVSNAYPNDGSQMEWLQIDFGHQIELNRWIVMHHGMASGNGGVNTREYALQYKQGDEWITADTVTGNTAHSTDRTVERFTARYVRLAVICPEQGNTGNGVTRIVEFAVSNDGVYTPKYSASSVFRNDSSLTADKAFDNDQTTFWASDSVNNDGSQPQWLAVDFGRRLTLNHWTVTHSGGVFNNAGLNTSDFKLQYSETGDPDGAWIDVDAVTGNTETVTDRMVAPFTARYVRLYVTRQTGNGGATEHARIVEFAVDYQQVQSVNVTFVGKYEEIIAVKTANSAEELAALLTDTTATALGSYQFVGWSESAADAASLFETAQDITVTAVYEQDTQAKGYHLSGLADMTARDGNGDVVTAATDLGFDQRITVTAEGDVAYWVLDGAKVGFGKNSLTFYVSGNNAVSVTFAGAAEAAAPAVVLQQATFAKGSERFTLTVIAQTSVPSGSVTEYGVIFAASETPLTALKSGGSAAAGATVTVKSSKTGANQQYMTHLLNVKPNKNRYAIAYAVVDGNTIYSDRIVHFATAADDVTIS